MCFVLEKLQTKSSEVPDPANIQMSSFNSMVRTKDGVLNAFNSSSSFPSSDLLHVQLGFHSNKPSSSLSKSVCELTILFS